MTHSFPTRRSSYLRAVERTMTADGARPGCDGCGGSDDNDTAGKVGCSLTCVTPVVAILDADGATAVAAGSVVDGLPERHPVGCITPVDPSPPRRPDLICRLRPARRRCRCQIGRASCRETGCTYVLLWGEAVA